MDQRLLDATTEACRSLIQDRFPDDDDNGAAAMLLDDGSILTGTAPAVLNPSVEVCHELEPFCGAYRLGRKITASVCLHRQAGGRTVVLSPCGVCRERLDWLCTALTCWSPSLTRWTPAPQSGSASRLSCPTTG